MNPTQSPSRLIASILRLALALIALAAPAFAQNLTATVAPNIGDSDNFVDIKNTSGGLWHFYSSPTPAAARMARVDSSGIGVYPWPTGSAFAPDAGHSLDRLYNNEYLRVYAKSLAAGTVIQIPYSPTLSNSATATISVTVTNGAQVTSLVTLDPSPSASPTIRWRVTFDAPVSGVTAANFAFSTGSADLTGQSITSVTADTAQPSSSWTITATAGDGQGILGLNWLGHRTETPSVPNTFTGFQYDLTYVPTIIKVPGNVLINPGTTTQLTVVASLRGGGTLSYQWYQGAAQTPNSATLISGQTGTSYTPPVFNTLGTYPFFCRVTAKGTIYQDCAGVVTVANPPVISSIDGHRTITKGQATTLTAVATGVTNFQEYLQYQWYQGASPDTSHPVGDNSASFTTPVLNDDATYWVRVTNGGQTPTNSPTVNIAVLEKPSLIVNLLGDVANSRDSQTSLREALAYANSLTGPQTITFAPALAGQTITLTTGANSAGDTTALIVSGTVTIQGPATTPGVTLAIAQGVQKRHFFVATGGNLTLSNLTLTNGYSNEYGGSIWSYGSLTVRGCAFTNNTAGTEGGAIQCWGDSPLAVFENCTFSNNTSHGIGGAFDAGAQQMTFRDLTIAHNTAAVNGSAMVLWKNSAKLVNCLIAGNTNDGIGLTNNATLAAQSTNNIIGTGGTGGLSNGVNANLTGVPERRLGLGAFGNHGGPTPTFALLPGSPAINRGAVLADLSTDQRGFSRTVLAGGLLGRYYALPATPDATLLAPLSNLEALAPMATVLTPRIDFGAGTESAPGDGSVLSRDGSAGNLFGGLGVNAGSDNVAALWTGYLNVPQTADYRFTTFSDDGSICTIDGTLVVTNNNLQPMTAASGTIHLSAGRHRVSLAYYEASGGAGMQWSWEQLTGAAPFARQIVPPQVLSCGSAPDIGAYEDATGDDDPDRDTLNNAQEYALGSDPLKADTDGDGFNDATEMLAGSDPALTSSMPPAAHIERVLGYGPGRGLDLSGTFVYAVNVGTPGAAGQAGDANFTADNVAGVTVTAPNEVASWTYCEFGSSAEDDVLEKVCDSLRWAPTGAANAADRTLKVKLAALAPGRKYKLQLIFADSPTYHRVFSIAVDGTVIFPSYDTCIAQGETSGLNAASAAVYEFTATSTETNIELKGVSSAQSVDINPILSGLTLEGLPTAAAKPVFVTTAGTYPGSVSVEISSASLGTAVRYTTDGSDPSEKAGTLYTAPFTLTTSATVKAIATGGGWLPSSTGSASYTVLTPLPAWRSLQGLAADGSQDLLVSSGDGVTNLLKYAFNMAPTAGSLSVPNTSTVAASGTAGLPAIFRDAQGRLTVRFVRRKAATAPGVTYTVETGANPGSLQPLDLSSAKVETIDDTWERVTAADVTVTNARFGRVKVSTQP